MKPKPAMLATTATYPARLWLSDDYWLEPKYDGIRTLVHIHDGQVEWLNRNTEPLTKPIPPKLHDHFKLLARAVVMVLDGELVRDETLGQILYVFDLPYLDAPKEDRPLRERRASLERLVQAVAHPQLRLTRCARELREKEEMIDAARREGWEGLMLKHTEAGYRSGRSTKMLKWKFTRDIDCIVGAIGDDDKESARLDLADRPDIGRCSLVGKPAIEVGDVVEVRFLYLGDNDRLVQPRMLRRRTDKHPEDCTTEQLTGTRAIKAPTN